MFYHFEQGQIELQMLHGHKLWAVGPDWAIYLTLGNFLLAFGNN